MPMTEDLRLFFSAKEFATPGLYNGQAVLGIFDHPDSEFGIGRVGFEAPSLRYVMAEQSLPAGAQSGDTLQLAGVTYTVQAFQRDGTGVVELILRG